MRDHRDVDLDRGATSGSAMCLLASIVISLRFYDACTNGTEAYATTFESIAAVLLLLAWLRTGWRAALRIFLSGAAFALALATKQNAVGGPVAGVATAVILSITIPGLRRRLLGLLLGALCGMAVAGGLIAWSSPARVSLTRPGTRSLPTTPCSLVKVIAGSCRSEYARGQLWAQLGPLSILMWLSGISIVALVVKWRGQPTPTRTCLPGSPAASRW